MAEMLHRATDTVVFGVKRKDNKPIIGAYVALYHELTAAIVGQTSSDMYGRWQIILSTSTPATGTYQVQFYGSGLIESLPPDGDWEFVVVGSAVEGIPGPSLVYKGLWDVGTEYIGTDTVRDCVKDTIDGFYYYAIATGTGQQPSTSATYWTKFSEQFASVATDLLLAQDASVGRSLTLGTDDGGTNYGKLRSVTASALYTGNGFYLEGNEAGTGVFRVGTVALEALTKGIAWDGTDFIIQSDNFAIDALGNVTLNGTITAEDGSIGGWLIGTDAIYKETGGDGIYITTAGITDLHGVQSGFIIKRVDDGDHTKWAGIADCSAEVSSQYLAFFSGYDHALHADVSASPFSVTLAGYLTAKYGQIGGSLIDDTSLTGGIFQTSGTVGVARVKISASKIEFHSTDDNEKYMEIDASLGKISMNWSDGGLHFDTAGISSNDEFEINRIILGDTDASGNIEIPGDIIQDDIVYPYLAKSIIVAGVTTLYITVKKLNGDATANLRHLVRWWLSSSEYGAPTTIGSEGVIACALTSGTQISGTTLPISDLTSTSTGLQSTLTTNSSTIVITVTQNVATGESAQAYIMAEIQGIVYSLIFAYDSGV